MKRLTDCRFAELWRRHHAGAIQLTTNELALFLEAGSLHHALMPITLRGDDPIIGSGRQQFGIRPVKCVFAGRPKGDAVVGCENESPTTWRNAGLSRRGTRAVTPPSIRNAADSGEHCGLVGASPYEANEHTEEEEEEGLRCPHHSLSPWDCPVSVEFLVW